MASDFPTSIDAIEDMGPTLSTNPHTSLHNRLRDAVAAVQTYAKARIEAIETPGWVTNGRIANGAVTDSKIVTVAVSKLTGTPVFPSLRSTTNVTADQLVSGDYLRAGMGTGNPSFRIQRFAGALSSSTGEDAVNHTITNAAGRVIAHGAYCYGPSGEALPLRVRYIDGVHFAVGVPTGIDPTFYLGQRWRGSILYTSDVAW